MTTLDKLILNKYHANEDDEQNSDPDCCYIGHLKNEPEACVAMTGKGTKILGLPTSPILISACQVISFLFCGVKIR